jgi:hypothetical protein
MATKIRSFYEYDVRSPVINCEDFISKLADAKWADDGDEVDALRGFAGERLREDVTEAVRGGLLSPLGSDLLSLQNGIPPRKPFDPFNAIYFEREEFAAFARNKWLVTMETADSLSNLSSFALDKAASTNSTLLAEECATAIQIGSNSKKLIDAYVEERARKIYASDEALTKGAMAKIIANELKTNGYRGERNDYLSEATVVRAIPSGLTGGRSKNGRKKKRK